MHMNHQPLLTAMCHATSTATLRLTRGDLMHMQEAEGLHRAQDGGTVSAVLKVLQHAVDATNAG